MTSQKQGPEPPALGCVFLILKAAHLSPSFLSFPSRTNQDLKRCHSGAVGKRDAWLLCHFGGTSQAFLGPGRQVGKCTACPQSQPVLHRAGSPVCAWALLPKTPAAGWGRGVVACSVGRDIRGVRVPRVGPICCRRKVLSIFLVHLVPKWKLPLRGTLQGQLSGLKRGLAKPDLRCRTFPDVLRVACHVLSRPVNGKGENVNLHFPGAKDTAVIVTGIEIACFITKLLGGHKNMPILYRIPTCRFN